MLARAKPDLPEQTAVTVKAVAELDRRRGATLATVGRALLVPGKQQRPTPPAPRSLSATRSSAVVGLRPWPPPGEQLPCGA